MAAVTHFTDLPQQVVPTAAAGVSVTPSATAFANSSWVQLTAGIANPIAVVGMIVDLGIGAVEYNIDIGTGPATSEVVAGTILGFSEPAGGLANIERFVIPIAVDANTRIAVRMRKLGTSTVVWTYKLVYYDLPAATLPRPSSIIQQAVHRAALY